jgi:hypothetical protein
MQACTIAKEKATLVFSALRAPVFLSVVQFDLCARGQDLGASTSRAHRLSKALDGEDRTRILYGKRRTDPVEKSSFARSVTRLGISSYRRSAARVALDDVILRSPLRGDRWFPNRIPIRSESPEHVRRAPGFVHAGFLQSRRQQGGDLTDRAAHLRLALA